jgi:hypothetical protein
MEVQLARSKNAMPSALRAVLWELDELARLRPNWDGDGAPAMEPGIIAGARTFIRGLCKQFGYRPHVVPMSSGKLQFVWYHGLKALELEFESPQIIRMLQGHSAAGFDNETAFPITDVDRAVDLIRCFMSGSGI